MSKNLSLEEKRAQLIIKYRNLKSETEKPVSEEDRLVYRLHDKKNQLIIMHAVLGQKTIGISYVRELKEMVEKEGASRGILVGDGKYTYSARSSAEELGACPQCGKLLTKKFSRKTRRFFVGCSGYPECQFIQKR